MREEQRMPLRLVQPEKSEQLRKPPTRRPNSETRAREYLTADEVKRLREAAARIGRHGFRDALLIEVTYRHGLRVTETCSLTWDQVHFDDGTLSVVRVKNGTPATHFLEGDELRRLKRETEGSRFVFCSERGGTLTTRAVHKLVARAGEKAGFEFPVHPHMLRHARGYALAARGEDTRAIQAYLGHKDIKSTVVYTDLAPGRFKGFGRD
jgi:site-specific recombinase XerD